MEEIWAREMHGLVKDNGCYHQVLLCGWELPVGQLGLLFQSGSGRVCMVRSQALSINASIT